MNSNFKKIVSAVVCVLICAMVLLPYANPNTNNEPTEKTFLEFQAMVEKEEVEKVEINISDTKFIFYDKDENAYITENPRNQGFKREMMDAGIQVEEFQVVEVSFLNDILPLIISGASAIALIFFIRNTMMKTGDKKNKTFEHPNVTLDDVIGPEEMKKDIATLIKYMKDPKSFSSKGVKMPKGVIFYGEPGTGKTLLAKAIAGEAKVPFYSKSGSDFVELFAGNGARKVRELFKEARKTKPCIIFIDEIDAVGVKRGNDHNGERDQTMNQLLAELDGFNTEEGILLVAATNRLNDLDPALIRSGRFDKHIHIPLPMTKEDRMKIINVHSRDLLFDSDVDLEKLAQMTIGLSGADIQSILNEAALISVSNDKDCIDKDSIDEAFTKKILKGHANKRANLEKDNKELSLIAYHEAGHAVMSKLYNKRSVPMVSIIGTTTGAGGFTLSMPDKMTILSREDLEGEIMQLYAGRAAEEIMGYGLTTGASNDIEKATSLIQSMVRFYGFEGTLLNYGRVEILSQNTADKIDLRVEEIAKELYQKTTDFLKEHISELNILANTLLEKETLEEKEIDALLAEK